MLTELEISKLWIEGQKIAKKKIKTCYFPGCNEKSINSHILQKNGILSQISKNGHVWEKKINQFSKKTFFFEESGLNNVFSFNCFCPNHDKELFKKIEDNIIDFHDYESCLLFTLRTLYNEIYRKEILVEQIKFLMKSEKSAEMNLELLLQFMEQQLLGIKDLQRNEFDIWSDYNNGTENFIFQHRELTNIDICLSGFYNYETTLEMHNYKLREGKDMERISEVFINFFPYNNKSILLMGYNKKDEKKLKPYINTFFKESEPKVQTKITNLLMFACETWIISEKLYKTKIQKVEDIFIAAIQYSIDNNNEREFFKVNIFKENYHSEMQKLKRYIY
jgi:hypothetical protein